MSKWTPAFQHQVRVTILHSLVAEANKQARADRRETAAAIREEARQLAGQWGIKSTEIEGLYGNA